jgi:hypothetical protein
MRDRRWSLYGRGRSLLLGGELLRRSRKLLCLCRLLLVLRGRILGQLPHSVVDRRAWLSRRIRLRLLTQQDRSKQRQNASQTGNNSLSGHRDLCYSKGTRMLQ